MKIWLLAKNKYSTLYICIRLKHFNWAPKMIVFHWQKNQGLKWLWACVSVNGNIRQTCFLSRQDSPQKFLRTISPVISTGLNTLWWPKIFLFAPVKGRSFTIFFDPVNRNHHQTQVRTPPLARLTALSWHTPEHSPSQYPTNLGITFNYRHLLSDLFQPKTSTFSTRALIWVHFKTVH